MFIARPHYMMQECKRALNGEARKEQPLGAVQADIFVCSEAPEATELRVDQPHEIMECRSEDDKA